MELSHVKEGRAVKAAVIGLHCFIAAVKQGQLLVIQQVEKVQTVIDGFFGEHADMLPYGQHGGSIRLQRQHSVGRPAEADGITRGGTGDEIEEVQRAVLTTHDDFFERFGVFRFGAHAAPHTDRERHPADDVDLMRFDRDAGHPVP